MALEDEQACVGEWYSGESPHRLAEFLRAGRAFLHDELPGAEGDGGFLRNGGNRQLFFAVRVLDERVCVQHI